MVQEPALKVDIIADDLSVRLKDQEVKEQTDREKAVRFVRGSPSGSDSDDCKEVCWE